MRVADYLSRKDTDAMELMMIVDDVSLRQELMNVYHNHEWFGGHLGALKMYPKLEGEGYVWSGIRNDCAKFNKACKQCQARRKPGFVANKAIFDHPKAESVWEVLHMDLIGPLELTEEGEQYILVVVDQATKYLVFKSVRGLTSKEVVQKMLAVFSDLGFPPVMISDGRESLLPN